MLGILLFVLMACGPDYAPVDDIVVPTPSAPVDLPGYRTDRFIQSRIPRVDILFVVDRSCSMDVEMPVLGANTAGLFDSLQLAGSDYHVGVTSMDLEVDEPGTLGRLKAVGDVRFLQNDTPDAVALFVQMMDFEVKGFEERGRSAVYRLLEIKRDWPANEGFYRPDADLHVVFITDEDDRSGSNPSLPDFRAWVDDLKTGGARVYLHGILNPPVWDACDEVEVGGPPTAFIFPQYAADTGGVLQSICEPEWSDYLDGVGELASGLTREFFLLDIPQTDPWTLEVVVREPGEDGPVERAFETCWMREIEYTPSCEVAYLADRNSVTFLDYLPAGGAVVEVRYGLARSW